MNHNIPLDYLNKLEEFTDKNYEKDQLFEVWKLYNSESPIILKDRKLFLTIVKNSNIGKMIKSYLKSPKELANIVYKPTNFDKKIILIVVYNDRENIIELCNDFNNKKDAKIYYNQIRTKYKITTAYALIFTLNRKRNICDLKYEKIFYS